MSFNARYNALDQELDIKGSERQEDVRVLSDEFNQLGHVVANHSGAGANLVAGAPAGQMRVTGLTGMSADDLTNFLQISNALTGSNNGVFLIVTVNSAVSVDVLNPAASVPDGNNGTILWTERQPYALEDDLNFERSDRKAIKGTVNFYDGLPTYQRTTAMGTNITASLSSIAGHTTDAMSLNRNLQMVVSGALSGTAQFLVVSAGNLKHSDLVDKTGVPIFDSAQNTFNGDYMSCYVEINDPANDNELTVQSGPQAGQKIFGLTVTGSSVSPNSVVVKWYSVPHGGDISTQSTAYSWENGQPLTASIYMGYNQRLDQLDINALRSQLSLGITSDADLRQDVNDLQRVIGSLDGAVSLAGLLTNTSPNYIFSVLSATPSVVQALNALNSGSGDRTYTGPYLTSGQTLAQSIQALSNGITAATSGSGVIRFITRLTSSVPSATPIPTPMAYVLDGTNNGKTLMVFTRGLLRDPGSPANGDDYTETTTGSVTFFSKQNKSDHINWLFL
jgi:hypothetical protein